MKKSMIIVIFVIILGILIVSGLDGKLLIECQMLGNSKETCYRAIYGG